MLNEKSFIELFNNNYNKVLGFVYHILGDKEEARDVVQTAYEELWKYRDRIHTSPLSYLYKIARNKAIKVLKKRTESRELDKIISKVWDDYLSHPTNPFLKMAVDDLLHIIIKDELTKMEFKVYYLRLKKYSHKEIAAILNITVRSSIATHHNAVKKVKPLLKK